MWSFDDEKWEDVIMNGVTIPDRQVMKKRDEDGYNHLGVIEVDEIKGPEMKEIFANDYKR